MFPVWNRTTGLGVSNCTQIQKTWYRDSLDSTIFADPGTVLLQNCTNWGIVLK